MVDGKKLPFFWEFTRREMKNPSAESGKLCSNYENSPKCSAYISENRILFGSQADISILLEQKTSRARICPHFPSWVLPVRGESKTNCSKFKIILFWLENILVLFMMLEKVDQTAKCDRIRHAHQVRAMQGVSRFLAEKNFSNFSRRASNRWFSTGGSTFFLKHFPPTFPGFPDQFLQFLQIILLLISVFSTE